MFNNLFKAISGAGRRRASASEPPHPILSLSGVLAYYRADEGVTVTGGRVTHLEDLTGHGFHLTASTTGPVYSATDSFFNNQPSMVFNGNNIGLKNNYIPTKAGSLGNQSGATLVAFVRIPSFISNRAAVSWGSAGTNRMDIGTGWSGRNEHDQFQCPISLSGSYAAKNMADANPYNATASYCIIARYTRTTNGPVEIWQNGVFGTKQNGSEPMVITNKTNEGPFRLGISADDNGWLSCSLAEVIVFNNPISSGTMNTILQYGSARYGHKSGSW
jgi:hypothetical protein